MPSEQFEQYHDPQTLPKVHSKYWFLSKWGFLGTSDEDTSEIDTPPILSLVHQLSTENIYRTKINFVDKQSVMMRNCVEYKLNHKVFIKLF